jgi:hypothetical protein
MKVLARSAVFVLVCLLASTAPAADPPARKRSNVERLTLERLAAVHTDVEKFKSQRTDIPARPGFLRIRST